MMKIAAENWRKYGNILGTNEIMGLMFHRDVMVLGLSDGVMCAATGFGLILQELISRGLISWNKGGWIIQSVCSATSQTHIHMKFVRMSVNVPDLRGHLRKHASYVKRPELTDESSGMGSFIYCCSPWLDVISGVAMDTYSLLRITWPCDAHEAAFLRIL